MRRIFALNLFLLTSALVANVCAQDGPPMPYIDKGACPFECCTYRQWTVEKPTAILSAMKPNAPVAFRVRKGERVRGMTGVVITERAGIAEALKNTTQSSVPIGRGDRIFLLTNLGEGFVQAWFKKRLFQAEPYDTSTFKVLRDAKSVWWVKIKNSKGKIGWSREPEHFGHIDQCGG